MWTPRTPGPACGTTLLSLPTAVPSSTSLPTEAAAGSEVDLERRAEMLRAEIAQGARAWRATQGKLWGELQRTEAALRGRSRTEGAPSAADEARRAEVRHRVESFGYEPYDWQLDGACSVLSGANTAVVRPAGDGKSLMVLAERERRCEALFSLLLDLVARGQTPA